LKVIVEAMKATKIDDGIGKTGVTCRLRLLQQLPSISRACIEEKARSFTISKWVIRQKKQANEESGIFGRMRNIVASLFSSFGPFSKNKIYQEKSPPSLVKRVIAFPKTLDGWMVGGWDLQLAKDQLACWRGRGIGRSWLCGVGGPGHPRA
jgi:hypothetical protein